MVALVHKTRRIVGKHNQWTTPYWTKLITRLIGSAARFKRPADYKIGICAAGRSVKGNYRQSNEDRWHVDTASQVFLVADGIGGHVGGEKAAEIAVSTLPNFLRDALEGPHVDINTMQGAAEEAVASARQKMADYADKHSNCCRMGSTIAMAAIKREELYFSHIGDSRVYLVRNGSIRRLTTDHTFVQVLVDTGVISEEEARIHPQRHCVLNHVGVRDLDQPPKVASVRLVPGDIIVLATDGLTGVVDDRAIERIVTHYDDAHDASDALIREAMRKDSKDNITCVVVQVLKSRERAYDDDSVDRCRDSFAA